MKTTIPSPTAVVIAAKRTTRAALTVQLSDPYAWTSQRRKSIWRSAATTERPSQSTRANAAAGCGTPRHMLSTGADDGRHRDPCGGAHLPPAAPVRRRVRHPRAEAADPDRHRAG